jgi:hypothetical protein
MPAAWAMGRAPAEPWRAAQRTEPLSPGWAPGAPQSDRAGPHFLRRARGLRALGTLMPLDS